MRRLENKAPCEYGSPSGCNTVEKHHDDRKRKKCARVT